MLGVLLTVAVTGFLYYRVRNTGLKALNRERQSFAVRVIPPVTVMHCHHSISYGMHLQSPTRCIHCQSMVAGIERHGFQYSQEGVRSGEVAFPGFCQLCQSSVSKLHVLCLITLLVITGQPPQLGELSGFSASRLAQQCHGYASLVFCMFQASDCT